MSALEMDFVRRYPKGAEVRAALSLPAEGVTVLFGPSGSGKSTILRCLAGLDRPQEGFIRFGGETWADGQAFVPARQRRIGMVFQDHALFPHMTARENVDFGARDGAAQEAVELLRIGGLLHRKPAQLSGGERQRVALARALATRPRLLLLDEPLSALDAPARAELRFELRALLHAAKVPAIFVTHERAEALALGDRLAVLAEGRIRQLGPVHEVFSAPNDLVVARVVGTENVAQAKVLRIADGIAQVQVGQAVLSAVALELYGDDCYACIRAEEIVLERTATGTTSARNELAATVVAVSPEGPLVRVVLDCGFRLVALVTVSSARDLALAPGARVAALVKAPAIRLVPR
ncbi:MAG TPA: ABC transporter ATP-binding protein [Myxococcales bacterium]|jgi:molybdate transport system ATP-binding protein